MKSSFKPTSIDDVHQHHLTQFSEKQKKLLNKAVEWQQKFKSDKTLASSVNPLESEQKDLIRRQAAWNVYSRVVFNVAVTTGVVGTILYASSFRTRR